MKRSKSSESTKSSSSASGRKRDERRRKKHGRKKGGDSSHSRRSCPSPVLGLDLSLTATGLVVWDGKRQVVLRQRRYKTSPVAATEAGRQPRQGQVAYDRFIGDDAQRINWLKKKIRLNVRKYGIAFCVIEGHAFAAQGRGKTVLSELAGVVKDMLLEERVAVVVKTPQQIKKHVTGDGKAQKIDVIYAAKKFDRKISDSDTADAWGAAKLGDDLYDELTE